MVPVWFRLVTRLDIINKKALSILQGLFLFADSDRKLTLSTSLIPHSFSFVHSKNVTRELKKKTTDNPLT